MGLFAISAYLTSEAYLTPVKPDYLSSVGLSLIEKSFKKLEKNYPNKMRFLGVVFVMVQNTKLMKNTMNIMRQKSEYNCFNSYLSLSTKIAETVEKNSSIFDLPSIQSKYKDEMRRIVEEFENRTRNIK
jgi:chromosome partitioning protein